MGVIFAEGTLRAGLELSRDDKTGSAVVLVLTCGSVTVENWGDGSSASGTVLVVIVGSAEPDASGDELARE